MLHTQKVRYGFITTFNKAYAAYSESEVWFHYNIKQSMMHMLKMKYGLLAASALVFSDSNDIWFLLNICYAAWIGPTRVIETTSVKPEISMRFVWFSRSRENLAMHFIMASLTGERLTITHQIKSEGVV